MRLKLTCLSTPPPHNILDIYTPNSNQSIREDRGTTKRGSGGTTMCKGVGCRVGEPHTALFTFRFR